MDLFSGTGTMLSKRRKNQWNFQLPPGHGVRQPSGAFGWEMEKRRRAAAVQDAIAPPLRQASRFRHVANCFVTSFNPCAPVRLRRDIARSRSKTASALWPNEPFTDFNSAS